MVEWDVIVETNGAGENIVVYPARREDLDLPLDYEDRLEWIRLSFETFFAHVRELDEYRRPV